VDASAPSFARVVSLASHDLRTPLATIFGFARTLTRSGELDERSARFVGMIEEASVQMTELLDELGVAARIVGGRWEPSLRTADTLSLARADDARVEARGSGAEVETEPEEVARALRSLAVAAARYGGLEQVAWEVDGRELRLSPVVPDAAPVLLGQEVRDLGSIVARLVIEALGGSLELDGDALRVTL
jgi:signal transduction histidine kinase